MFDTGDLLKYMVKVHEWRDVKKWRLLLEDGLTNVHEEQRSGRKFFVTENMKETDNAEPGESRRFTISELHENFPALFRCPN
jgi:hypothetical protein